MYLGHKGYKVANIPLVPGIEPPAALFKADQNKIMGLIIDPSRLAEIRIARVAALGSNEIGDYADLEKIFEELEWSREIFKRNKKWPVLDVTGKVLEENSVEIEKIILSHFLNSRVNELKLKSFLRNKIFIAFLIALSILLPIIVHFLKISG